MGEYKYLTEELVTLCISKLEKQVIDDCVSFSQKIAYEINEELLKKILEKSKPKKVKEMKVYYFPETYDYDYTSGRCPNCGEYLQCDEYNQIRYCYECGQKLDWRIDEN